MAFLRGKNKNLEITSCQIYLFYYWLSWLFDSELRKIEDVNCFVILRLRLSTPEMLVWRVKSHTSGRVQCPGTHIHIQASWLNRFDLINKYIQLHTAIINVSKNEYIYSVRQISVKADCYHTNFFLKPASFTLLFARLHGTRRELISKSKKQADRSVTW